MNFFVCYINYVVYKALLHSIHKAEKNILCRVKKKSLIISELCIYSEMKCPIPVYAAQSHAYKWKINLIVYC